LGTRCRGGKKQGSLWEWSEDVGAKASSVCCPHAVVQGIRTRHLKVHSKVIVVVLA
jgi:hypothetical protein